jgi:hypothetical protein
MAKRSAKTPFSASELLALRLLKRRHRPRAVQMVTGIDLGSLSALKAVAVTRGWSFPAMPRSSAPVLDSEYVAACRDAGVEPTLDLRGLSAAKDALVWPHLQTYPAGPVRSEAAAAQAKRILDRVKRMRHVPPRYAGGGEFHFGRECAEHLAALIAHAPGPRYIDDPRALRPEPRLRFEPPAAASYAGCALADFAAVA